jgi:hypothetical protein
MDDPCQLCQAPDRLQPRAVKRIDLAPMVAGHMLTTEMLVCQGCREMVDLAAPLVWLEDGYVFYKFADGVFAKRHDAATNASVLVNLPDETTYHPGQSSWPPALRPHGPRLP